MTGFQAYEAARSILWDVPNWYVSVTLFITSLALLIDRIRECRGSGGK